MKTMIVDDEPIMLKSLLRMSKDIDCMNIVGSFTDAGEALEYAGSKEVELAILDIEMPTMSGLQLAKELRRIKPDILVVFITAYRNYIKEANDFGADDYIVKPYTKDTIIMMAERMRLLSRRQKKDIYIQMFGNFLVTKKGKPLSLRGKGKEILAFIVSKRGKEVSNEEIYSTLWENRPYSNVEMKVYYNALRRLKSSLAKEGIDNLLISTARGKRINTDIFDCDYYNWLDGEQYSGNYNEEEFLSEYSWGEYIIASMMYEF